MSSFEFLLFVKCWGFLVSRHYTCLLYTSWIQVENSDSYGDDDPDYFWYYFQANGKAYKAPTSGKTSFKNINGKKYTFDSEGKMLYGWINTESERQTGDDAWTNGTYFCGDENDGAQANGCLLYTSVPFIIIAGSGIWVYITTIRNCVT